MATQEIWTTIRILAWTKEFLAGKGVENSRLEAEWMLCAATGLDRMGLYLNFERALDEAELLSFRTMVSRRAKREPLQYILGSQEFCGLEFEVTPDVLIPRHDTETLVNEAVARRPGTLHLLDIGTGSGCIAIAMAKRLPGATVTAIELSEAALAVARRNAAINGAKVEFLAGSLLEPVAGRRFDLILSNPPYIPADDIAQLEPEVRDYEPLGALVGGQDGMDLYRAMIPQAPSFLNTGGMLLVEIGISQSLEVVRLFQESGFEEIFTARDPCGIERVVGGVFNG
ncbi:MAG: peptide chain release factor N(5)-glutamine methyltransferase [Deltaproteobacteria bacterium]